MLTMWVPDSVLADLTPSSVAVVFGELWFIERIEGNLIHGEIVE